MARRHKKHGFNRTFGQAVKKYQLKYSGTNVTNRLTALGTLVEENYETGISNTYSAVGIAKEVLANGGIPVSQWGMYIAFAEELAKYSVKYGGATLQSRVNATAQYFENAYDANPAILTQIAQAVLGVSTPY